MTNRSSLVRIRGVDSGKWWLVGAPRNWRAGDNWLVAHDLFHHEPGDKGTLAEEVMSFGTELWLEYCISGHYALSSSTLSGTLLESFEEGPLTTKKLKALLLPCPEKTLAHARLSTGRQAGDETVEYFRKCVEAVTDDMVAHLRQFPRCLGLCEELSTEQQMARLAGWLEVGLLRASLRYPDPCQARRYFMWLQDLVSLVREGETLRLEMSQNGKFIPQGRIGNRVMLEAPFANIEQPTRGKRFKDAALYRMYSTVIA